MLQTPQAVVDALGENSERPYGTARNVVAEELVQAAEQFEDPDVLVTALLELMEGYEYSGEHRKSPVVFARLLKLWDSSPGAFNDWETVQLFWRFKWVTTSLLQVPDVPLASLQGWLEEMRRRYDAAGHGLQPVAALRHRLAVHTGTANDDTYDLWVTRPRERMSDCEACEIRHRALHHVRCGEDAKALEIWTPVFESTVSCQEEPWVSQAFALLPLVRTGRVDEARSAHLAGYRRARGDAEMTEELGLHLEFCALTRNEGRGLEILAENRALFGSAGAPLAQLHFLTGVEVLLARVVGEGHGSAAVAGPLGRGWTADELLDHVRREADALAAAFDARNGTSAVSDRRRRRLEQRPPVDEPLPLGLRVRRSAAADAPTAGAPSQPAAVEIPEDFAELVRKARAMASQADPGDTELWRRIAATVAEPGYVHDAAGLGAETLLHGELAEERAYAAREDDRYADAAQALTEAVRHFEDGGHHAHAVAARARVVGLRFDTDDSGDRSGDGSGDRSGDASGGTAPDRAADWAALDEAVAQARALTSEDAAQDAAAGSVPEGPGLAHAKYLAVLRVRLHAAFTERLQAPEDVSARERFDAAVALTRTEAERLGSARDLALTRQYGAGIAARTGRLDDAIEELRTVQRILEDCGRPWLAARPMAQLAEFLVYRGDHGEAVALLQQALASAARHGDASFPVAATYSLLGHAGSHLGDLTGAVRYLTEAADRLERDGDLEGSTAARLDLADTFTRAGQDADAVALLESLARDETLAGIDERMLAQIRLSLARGLGSLGEHRASAEEFVQLTDTVAGWEEQETHTLVAAQAATALARADRLREAESCYERAVASHEGAAHPMPVLGMMRDFASLAVDRDGAEGIDTALEHLREADALCGAVPAESGFPHWYQRGVTHYERARLLARVERFHDALAEAERAMTAQEEGGPDGEEPRAEALRFAALIEANGLEEPGRAVARLDAGVRRCEDAGLPEAAKILACLRDQLAAAG